MPPVPGFQRWAAFHSPRKCPFGRRPAAVVPWHRRARLAGRALGTWNGVDPNNNNNNNNNKGNNDNNKNAGTSTLPLLLHHHQPPPPTPPKSPPKDVETAPNHHHHHQPENHHRVVVTTTADRPRTTMTLNKKEPEKRLRVQRKSHPPLDRPANSSSPLTSVTVSSNHHNNNNTLASIKARAKNPTQSSGRSSDDTHPTDQKNTVSTQRRPPDHKKIITNTLSDVRIGTLTPRPFTQVVHIGDRAGVTIFTAGGRPPSDASSTRSKKKDDEQDPPRPVRMGTSELVSSPSSSSSSSSTGSSSSSSSTASSSSSAATFSTPEKMKMLSLLLGEGSQGSVLPGRPSHPRWVVLPVIQASALLDPKEYCRQSAKASGPHSSNSGADAAYRLLRGKKDLVDLLRAQVHKASRRRGPPLSYVLTGHGIPGPLLQHVIDWADTVLHHFGEAAECSFNNHRQPPKQQQQQEEEEERPLNQNAAHRLYPQDPSGAEGPLLQLDWVRIREKDGTNRASPWPAQEDWDHAMQLYVTAMHRLVTKLGVVLRPGGGGGGEGLDSPPAPSMDEVPVESAVDDDDWIEAPVKQENSLSFFPSSTLGAVDYGFPSGDFHPPQHPRHWNVELLRGLQFPTHVLPTLPPPPGDRQRQHHQASPPQQLLHPLVEWTPLGGLAAPGHVCIRLQGFPSSLLSSTMATSTDLHDKTSPNPSLRRQRKQAVTLCFDACFRDL